ncbi:MAG: hypothetical protein ACFFDN_14130, partial [Candidatus Hodarchaeota archaeon]
SRMVNSEFRFLNYLKRELPYLSNDLNKLSENPLKLVNYLGLQDATNTFITQKKKQIMINNFKMLEIDENLSKSEKSDFKLQYKKKDKKKGGRKLW